ncbi:hypothetical protein DL767_004323 [Monosporascus sp. MG133]|nr:hypothetical protein DL767_004323 [Monosporascus sp. MG133]
MLGLPEGWESDYDGQRWFYRYKPNGLTQFQFPQPGDEFPSFVGDDGELEPEERLASELQLRQRNAQELNTHGDTKRSRSGRKKTVERIKDDEFSMGATGYFDPSSFMYFGPEEPKDAGSKADKRGIEADGAECKEIEESPANAVDPAQSPGPTPSTVNSELATNRPLASDESSELVNVAAELPGGNERKRSPLGLIAELAGSYTAKCADELAPVELDAMPAMRPGVAELPADNYPVKRRTPQPRPPPAPMQPVDSYPLVSASFAYPPLRTAEKPGKSSTRVEEAQPQKQTDALSEEGRTSADKTQVKYQPFMPGQHIGEAKKDAQRSSMVLASTTVLQTQNSERGPLDSIVKRKEAAVSMSNDSGEHELFIHPVDPRRPESTSPSKVGHPSESVPQSPQVPPKIPIDQPSPGHPPQTGPHPNDDSTTIIQGVTDPAGSSPTRGVAPHRSSVSSSTVSPAVSSADSGPPLASTVLAELPHPSQVLSTHAPDSSQSYSLSEQPVHKNAISTVAIENHSEASTAEESQQAQKPVSGAVVGQQSACTRGATMDPISQTGARNGPHAEGLSHVVSSSSPLQSAVSPLQSVTSSPAQSSVSLNRASSTTSSYLQPVSGTRRQQSDSISRQASVSTQQTSPDATPPTSSPSPAADVVLPKPKPFPMLPGQVTPMPSQIGSDPVPLRALPDNSASAQSPSTPSSPRPSQSGEPLSPVNPGSRQPAQNHTPLQARARTASSQMTLGSPYQPLPQTQVNPGQQGAPSQQQSHQRLPSVHTVPTTTWPPIPAQQPAQYPALGPRTNGAVVASYTGKGVKKWAKKIFRSSSPTPNAPIAGPPGIPGPVGFTYAAQPTPGASGNALIGSVSRQMMQHGPPGGHHHPQFALMQPRAPYQPAATGMQPAPPMPLPAQGRLRTRSGAGAEATGW